MTSKECFTVTALRARFADESMPWTRPHVESLINQIAELTKQRDEGWDAFYKLRKHVAKDRYPGMTGVVRAHETDLRAWVQKVADARPSCDGCCFSEEAVTLLKGLPVETDELPESSISDRNLFRYLLAETMDCEKCTAGFLRRMKTGDATLPPEKTNDHATKGSQTDETPNPERLRAMGFGNPECFCIGCVAVRDAEKAGEVQK